jgi:predicted metal-dependent HD superfamily phosphohydrolase
MHLDLVREQCQRPAEVELALWFHDAIYDPQAPDNERRSADWATLELTSAGAAQSLTASIQSLILITQHNAIPVAHDEQFLVDIDLSILSASRDRFLEYEEQIRIEYSWVPHVIFRRERAKVLRHFLSRPSIYSTEFFREKLEANARRNLAESIARLETATSN